MRWRRSIAFRSDDPDYVPALKVKAKALYLLRRDPEAEDDLETCGGSRASGRRDSVRSRPHLLPDRADTRRRPNRSGGRSRSTHAPTKPGTISASPPRLSGTSAQAQQHYLKAIALVHKDHPRYDVVYANFADLLIKLGNYQRAFDLAAEAAERNPSEPRNFFLAGKALVRLDRSDLSVRWFEQAIALERRLPRAVLSARSGLPQARAS